MRQRQRPHLPRRGRSAHRLSRTELAHLGVLVGRVGAAEREPH